MTWALALLGPAIVTAVLVQFSHQVQRDYVFIYLGLVAVVGVIRGLWPALACAGVSFMLVDYFFVPPVGTLTIADEQDIVNLVSFLVVACVVGLLASLRRRALLQAEALTRQLQDANTELIMLNKEQSETATSELRLASEVSPTEYGLFPPGTTSCVGPAPGSEVPYFEALGKNPLALDAGQGLAGLPDSILQMTGTARSTLIDIAKLGVAQVGTVYTGGTGKIAQHGGDNPQDRAVPIVVSGAGIVGGVNASAVETTQIAPTMLQLLGLDPHSLKAVQIEGTPVLPLGD